MGSSWIYPAVIKRSCGKTNVINDMMFFGDRYDTGFITLTTANDQWFHKEQIQSLDQALLMGSARTRISDNK